MTTSAYKGELHHGEPHNKNLQDVEAPTLKCGWSGGKHSSLMCENPQGMPPSTFRIPSFCRCPPLTRRACPRRREESGPALRYGYALSASGQKLLDAGVTTVYNFRGGVQAWKEAGYATARGQRTLSLERQVQIATGSVVLLGTLLGVMASPWFLLLSGVVGAGLVYAGGRGDTWRNSTAGPLAG